MTGSQDLTAAILAELGRREPGLCLRVIRHERNQGYGAALATGLDAAGKDLLFYTDGDGQFDACELAGFVRELDSRTDMVIGWRRKRADPSLRLINALG